MFRILKKKRKEKGAFEQSEAYEPVKSSDVSHSWKGNKNEFVIAVHERICHKCCDGERMERLSKEERIFYVVQQLEIEVNNGGFSQFFFNSSGDFANELYDAFMAVGAEKRRRSAKEPRRRLANQCRQTGQSGQRSWTIAAASGLRPFCQTVMMNFTSMKTTCWS